MYRFELILRTGDDSETRVIETERPLMQGEHLQIDGDSWVVIRDRAPSDASLYRALLECRRANQ